MSEGTSPSSEGAAEADASRGLAGSKRPLGVYVHFPWCLQKCPYCDFLSVAAERADIPHRAYADGVIGELERRRADLIDYELSSVYFGGGTPSLWDPGELRRVLGAIRSVFVSSPDLEITVECNPSSFDRARGEALLAAGANRVSLGVQGLDDGRLRFLGRLHDAEGGLRAVRAAVASGMPRVTADLIFGVPGQSIVEAQREAEALAETGIRHLSAYALTIEPGTEFGARARKGQLPLAVEDEVADAFLAVDSTLSALGFNHYEISNFAQPGEESRHNLGYWLGRDYLGLGCGAWGTITLAGGTEQRAIGARLRYRTTPSPERYLASAARWPHVNPWLEERSTTAVVEPIDNETALRERLMLGLRLARGVDLEQLKLELGVDPLTQARERTIRKLVARGRLEHDGAHLRVPRHAWLLADGTIAELL
jgi:oxygen-independent coproporphyrinogen-3 oxidase